MIWITGYSSAGKTSIGRLVAADLKRSGTPSIFLDGDDLRGILGDGGYSDDERRELARVYFRLCSHIASQDVVVVIAAAAMYREVYGWFSENIERGMLVYVDAPEDLRRHRDATARKQVYDASPGNVARYEPPSRPQLTLDNSEGADLHAAADQVIDGYRLFRKQKSDRGRTAHWNSSYAAASAPLEPSPFAIHVRQSMAGDERDLIEVGCGNGRDSAHFAASGLAVTAIDMSEVAIQFCREKHDAGIVFERGKVDELGLPAEAFDVVYSRFVLHAMTLDEEEAFHTAVARLLRPGGRLFVETRSIHDPLARKGEVLSPTERIHGHYRRFVDADELATRVTDAGLEIESRVESNGLAVFEDDDPVVVRLVARRP